MFGEVLGEVDELDWVLIRRSHSKTCQFNLKQAKQVLGEFCINLVA